MAKGRAKAGLDRPDGMRRLKARARFVLPWHGPCGRLKFGAGGTVRKRRMPGPTGEPIDVTELSFQNVREHWNEYLLDDGTILKLKAVATEVFKQEGQYDAEGNPIYLLRSKNVMVVSAPDHLKKPSEPAEEGGA
jgi:hypothetical protein